MKREIAKTFVPSNRRASDREVSRVGGDDDTAEFDSETLFGRRKEIGIRHEGQLYRLRITRHGKLILNK